MKINFFHILNSEKIKYYIFLITSIATFFKIYLTLKFMLF
jgi:hypothetical protein